MSVMGVNRSTTYGVITGELKDISATTFLDENGNPYYKGDYIE